MNTLLTSVASSTTEAIGFAVLGYLDQNLTSVIVNRPSNNLKKPAAYHLDLLRVTIHDPFDCVVVSQRRSRKKDRSVFLPKTDKGLFGEHSRCPSVLCWACLCPWPPRCRASPT